MIAIEATLATFSNNINLYKTTNSAVFNKINPLQINCSLCAIIKYKNSDLNTAFNNNCIILDDIQDPGNLGNILRTTAALNSTIHIVLSTNSVDAYHPKVLRASMGTQFLVNIHQNIDIVAFINQYQSQGKVSGCQVKLLMF